MQVKFVVSMLLYYVFLYIKNEFDFSTKRNVWKWNVEYGWMILLVFFLIPNPYAKMSLFVCLTLVLTLLFLWKNKKGNEKKNQLLQWVSIVLYALPTLVFALWYQEKYVTIFYLMMGILSFFSGYLLTFLKKCAEKRKKVYNKNKKKKKK